VVLRDGEKVARLRRTGERHEIDLIATKRVDQSMIDHGLYDEGFFVVIAPDLNYHVQDATEAYQAQLREPENGKVRFVTLTLEDVIEVMGDCPTATTTIEKSKKSNEWPGLSSTCPRRKERPPPSKPSLRATSVRLRIITRKELARLKQPAWLGVIPEPSSCTFSSRIPLGTTYAGS
jgi:hypothetical protein